jgi:hypothetical protein
MQFFSTSTYFLASFISGTFLIPIQKSLTLLQIMPWGEVNLAPLLHVIETSKKALLFLLRVLLATISTVPSIHAIVSLSYVDHTILLPWGPLAPGCQKLSPGFEGFYAYISDCKQIRHRFGFHYDNLLQSCHRWPRHERHWWSRCPKCMG